MSANYGHGAKRPRKEALAIAALLTEPTVRRAARKAGVSERTLRTWLTDPAFLSAYRGARRRVLEHAVSRLQQASGRAVSTLVKALASDKAADRIRAAVAILDQSRQGAELVDFAERLEELEAAEAARQASTSRNGHTTNGRAFR